MASWPIGSFSTFFFLHNLARHLLEVSWPRGSLPAAVPAAGEEPNETMEDAFDRVALKKKMDGLLRTFKS